MSADLAPCASPGSEGGSAFLGDGLSKNSFCQTRSSIRCMAFTAVIQAASQLQRVGSLSRDVCNAGSLPPMRAR